MKLKNFEKGIVVYFKDNNDNDYRATSLDNIQRRYGEAWVSDYYFIDTLSKLEKNKIEMMLGEDL
jgi:hypothetical protein